MWGTLCAIYFRESRAGASIKTPGSKQWNLSGFVYLKFLGETYGSGPHAPIHSHTLKMALDPLLILGDFPLPYTFVFNYLPENETELYIFYFCFNSFEKNFYRFAIYASLQKNICRCYIFSIRKACELISETINTSYSRICLCKDEFA